MPVIIVRGPCPTPGCTREVTIKPMLCTTCWDRANEDEAWAINLASREPYQTWGYRTECGINLMSVERVMLGQAVGKAIAKRMDLKGYRAARNARLHARR